MRGACKILEGKTEAKKPLGRPRRRWVDNIKMHPPKWEGAWTGLIWFRIGTACGLLKMR